MTDSIELIQELRRVRRARKVKHPASPVERPGVFQG